MNLKKTVQTEIAKAQKAKNEPRLAVLRLLNAEIKNQEIDNKRQEITNDQVLTIINSQIKKLREGIELFKRGKRDDLITESTVEIKILQEFLPTQLSDKELEKEIDVLIAANPNLPHPGALIGIAVKKLSGRADNARIAHIVKQKTAS